MTCNGGLPLTLKTFQQMSFTTGKPPLLRTAREPGEVCMSVRLDV